MTDRKAEIAALGCCICEAPAEIHHVRREGLPRKLAPMIPLCPDHYRNGGPGVAVHAGRESWEAEHGPEAAWVEWAIGRLADG